MLLPQPAQQAIWQSNLPATPSTTQWGTTVTAHATPHTKGSYAQLVASTTYESFGFWLAVAGSATSAARTDQLLDVAIGAAASEVVILSNLLVGWRNLPTVAPYWVWIPLYIPKGTRVSARIQALITVDVLDVQIQLNEGANGMPGQIFSGCDAYGIDTATSQGTSHTPGNTGAESTAASIGSVTSKQYRAVMLGVGGVFSGVVMATAAYHWELQIGGVTRCEWTAYASSSEFMCGPFPPSPFYTPIPSGAQLQIRGECSGTADAQDVAYYCFY